MKSVILPFLLGLRSWFRIPTFRFGILRINLRFQIVNFFNELCFLCDVVRIKIIYFFPLTFLSISIAGFKFVEKLNILPVLDSFLKLTKEPRDSTPTFSSSHGNLSLPNR